MGDMKHIQIIQTTPDELNELIQSGIKEQLENLIQELKNQSFSDDLLTRSEVCSILSVNPSTLWNWTTKGKVKSYHIGNRVYYKKSELLESLKIIE